MKRASHMRPLCGTLVDDWDGRLEQVWFRGSHGDVGGQLAGIEAARPLSNIPFIWMLERAEICGLALPKQWQSRYPTDANAPSVGTWKGWAKIFLLRKKRVIGQDPSERIHDSALVRTQPMQTSWLGRRSKAS